MMHVLSQSQNDCTSMDGDCYCQIGGSPPWTASATVTPRFCRVSLHGVLYYSSTLCSPVMVGVYLQITKEALFWKCIHLRNGCFEKKYYLEWRCGRSLCDVILRDVVPFHRHSNLVWDLSCSPSVWLLKYIFQTVLRWYSKATEPLI